MSKLIITLNETYVIDDSLVKQTLGVESDDLIKSFDTDLKKFDDSIKYSTRGTYESLNAEYIRKLLLNSLQQPASVTIDAIKKF